jgi:hypothetical protein
MATAYCMKCRKKREISNPRRVMLKNRDQSIQNRETLSIRGGCRVLRGRALAVARFMSV